VRPEGWSGPADSHGTETGDDARPGETVRSISGVKRPVIVFCWLGS
jgi:hypothetical protein